ncbi:hypothetical protein KIN20_015668 [Parelaphostrongylus tenuis]|uniref:Uncharacterized protein n=1 Tax=Parelaphostrongylus tenuis TaxID=148309 RepID=A0AAD5MIV1_PARTN|nr:hypothetical protein KIN20_015668 [Parelaphostrongylus tenuis]
METDDLSNARFLQVHSYIEERAAQVANLLQVVDNANLVSGEVTKGPRTAAQRLPRHMRRRAMAYNVRRFPKGLRKYAAPFLALSKHRNKPPSRFYRRRPRNLLLNYIRRQKRNVWLETHIWHAKRFHVVDRWGYRLPDRSFQRSFRPCYRDSTRHCTVRDKSYLSCLLISHEDQALIISMLSSLCVNTTSPTFAFKSSLDGRYEISTLIYHPGQYPLGFIGPVRFQWIKNNDMCKLALWMHPSCREEVLFVLKELLELVEEERMEDNNESNTVPHTIEEWRLSRMKVRTNTWTGKNGIRVQDLRDQLVRIRLYGPLAVSIVCDSLKLVSDENAPQFRTNHSEWRDSVSKLTTGSFVDGTIFSLLIEDPRISRLSSKKVPLSEGIGLPLESYCVPQAAFWDNDIRMKALSDRVTDSELNKLKGQSLGPINDTSAKIPVLIVMRNGGSGRCDTLSGCELIVPCGFGMDFWVALQLRTARASGLRDDLTAHLEASRFHFPTDILDSRSGLEEIKRMQFEHEAKYDRRPHNRRVQYWDKLSVKYPFTFEYVELVNDWLAAKQKSTIDHVYVIRERVALLSIARWFQGKSKLPADLHSAHYSALVPVELQCVARGKPKRYGLVCLPTHNDMMKYRNRFKSGPVQIVQEPRNLVEDFGTNLSDIKTSSSADTNDWKDVVSIDQSTREKPISLKELFPDTKIVDRSLKRKLLNRRKKECAKRRRVNREERLKKLNEEKEAKERIPYRESANRLIIGRIIRGDFSFYTANGRALSYVPLCALEEVRNNGGMVLIRNFTSKYYHPAKLSILNTHLEL